MTSMTGVCALIPAAGRGARFGSTDENGLPQNKVFAQLLGRPLLGWTLEAVSGANVDRIVVIGHASELPRLTLISEQYGREKVTEVIEGGSTRQESVYKGLQTQSARNSEVILVHDGARPCVTQLTLNSLKVIAYQAGAVSAAVSVTDTLVRSTNDEFSGKQHFLMSEPVPRDGVYAIQTPQAFQREILQKAHDRAREDNFTGTDDAGLVHRVGLPVRLYDGDTRNIKVTRPTDLAFAEMVLRHRMAVRASGPPFAIGHGYDIHRFAEGRPMVLGGVTWPSTDRGLLGHSDADACLHALCDALLGAAGMGDIGTLFPPSDMRHKDRPSIDFLTEVAQCIERSGWVVGNVDITILAEWPKITPRVDEMKARIASVLKIDTGRIAIKATTHEGLGAIGRGEGIAVHATVLLTRP